jgi:MinD superfamily P-loop ATPase containing an inserted ferredoxin domain
MLREIIEIEDDKCNGCGKCIPNCAEGALQLIDGKARLISDLFCDGLGACVGYCPQNAITVIKREAEPYDEKNVMAFIVKNGTNTIKAHLCHLKEHNEMGYLMDALDYLNDNGIKIDFDEPQPEHAEHQACPGAKSMVFEAPEAKQQSESHKRVSHLKQWPIQLHLVSPSASYYRDGNLLLTADCVGFAYPDFHKDFLDGKSIAIACPKLDTNREVYLEKLTRMIDENNLQSISVLIMQVPCCGGLLQIAQQAVEAASRKIPVDAVIISITGEILDKFNAV